MPLLNTQPHPNNNVGIAAICWPDSADEETITTGTGGVSDMSDKSGAINNISQATASKRPDTGVDTINGLNAVRYVASDNHLDRDNLITGNEYTIFFTAKFTAGSSTEPHLLSTRTNGLDTGISIYVERFVPLNRIGVRWGTGATGVLSSNNDVVAPNVPFLLTVRVVNGQPRGLIRVDGVNELTGFTWAPTSLSQPTMVVGSNVLVSSLGNWEGLIGDGPIIYPADFNDRQISHVEKYLKNKWGLN